METRAPYRRHAPQFKLQLCQEIRSGALGRREAQKKYSLSDNLIQLWLAQYDRDRLDARTIDASVLQAFEAKIAALERKVGQLTMALDGLEAPVASLAPVAVTSVAAARSSDTTGPTPPAAPCTSPRADDAA